jgi:hypothetical protein
MVCVEPSQQFGIEQPLFFIVGIVAAELELTEGAIWKLADFVIPEIGGTTKSYRPCATNTGQRTCEKRVAMS